MININISTTFCLEYMQGILDNECLSLISFILLFLASIWYVFKEKNFLLSNAGLIVISIVQGILISINYVGSILQTVPYAIFYYLICIQVLPMLKLFGKKKNITELNDPQLEEAFKNVSTFDNLKFEFKEYSSQNSFNAFVMPKILPLFSKNYQIYIGEDLKKELNLEEIKSVLAHELSHATRHHVRGRIVTSIIFLAVIALLSEYTSQIILGVGNPRYILANIFLFFMIGIAGINRILWHFEYDADSAAINLLKEPEIFCSALQKLNKHHPQKNYGSILNIILYDHPPIEKRIKECLKTFSPSDR